MQTPTRTPTTSATTKPITTTTIYILLSLSAFSLLFLLSLSSSPQPPSPTVDPHLFPTHPHPHHLPFLPHFTQPKPTPIPNPVTSPPTPPSLAYLISGSANNSGRILRLLYSVYHPKNHYLLHLDLSAPQTDRDFLALTVQSVPLFRAAQNVNVIGKADFAYKKLSSSVSSILHGASLLLRLSDNWDWFINLSAADYPLVTQDDLLHILSYLPKDLNFVNHTSYIGWRESRGLKPIVVDPGLYLSEEDDMYYATQRRKLPDAYRLFIGSPFAILSRKSIEFCILGTENLPRTLLMYLSNTLLSQHVYFPTVLCNSRPFNKTVINHSLKYTAFDTKHEPRLLNSTDFKDLIKSGAAFASPFLLNDPILDRIDREILGRSPGNPLPGGWCLGDSGSDKCTVWGDADVLRPSKGARRLEKRIVKLLTNGTFRSHQCIVVK
ncbi:hypothetical protein LguiB_025863 [Lonicera macranthoides]